MPSLDIGARVRELRKEKQMTLSALAAKSGASTSLLSQIERGLVAPSVVSLYHIAQALDTDISYFFTAARPHYALQRKGSHRIIITNNGLNRHEMLGPDWEGRGLDLLRLFLKGGQAYDRECLAHQGEECCYVLSGELTVLIGGEELTLRPGDSLYFDSARPHLYLNAGAEDCESIWAITPKFF